MGYLVCGLHGVLVMWYVVCGLGGVLWVCGWWVVWCVGCVVSGCVVWGGLFCGVCCVACAVCYSKYYV